MTAIPRSRPRTSAQRVRGRRLRRAAIAVTLAAVGATVALDSAGGQTARAAHLPRPAAGSGAPTALPASDFFSAHTLQQVYGVSALLAKGVDGRGETIVLPEQPVKQTSADRGVGSVRQDLAAFDARFHLPAAGLVISRAPGYGGEIANPGLEGVLDAEVVHAIAPDAKINVMFFGSPAPYTPGDFGTVVHAAAERGNVVSMSFGRCEGCVSAAQRRSLALALRFARDRHVTVIAASGDSGAANTNDDGAPIASRTVSLPCASPLVTCVGGTTLAVHDGGYGTETTWNAGGHLPIGGATGGGISPLYARPSYQNGLPADGAHRGVPDVAAQAGGKRALAIILLDNGRTIQSPAGGTSAAAPMWAGIVALADQDAHRHLGFINDALYRIGRSSRYSAAFHDITTGNNSVTLPSGRHIPGYHAAPSWDPVTGWGTPKAQTLVPLLGTEVRTGDGNGL